MLREGKRERDRKRDTQERKRRWEKMKVMSSYISFFLSFLSLFLFNPIRTGGGGLIHMGRKFWKIFKSLILRHSQHPQNWNFLSKTFNGSICAYSILYPQIFWFIEGWKKALQLSKQIKLPYSLQEWSPYFELPSYIYHDYGHVIHGIYIECECNYFVAACKISISCFCFYYV